MNYAIKSPDGESLHKVVLDASIPEGRTLADLDLWPVDTTIPEGFRQDFSQGPKTARGWQLLDEMVVPYVVAIPPPDNTPPPPMIEDEIAALKTKVAALETELAATKQQLAATRAKQVTIESKVTTLESAVAAPVAKG